MTRAAINWILDPTNPRRRWIAAGIVVLGLAGMHQEPQGPAGVRMAGAARQQAVGYGAGYVNSGTNAAPAGYAPSYQNQGDEPAMASGYAAPQTGGFVPTASPNANDNSPSVPTSGDSVPESVNTNFSDYMRDQQRVVSEHDSQTYIVDSNADPNQMTDTRDSVSSFSAATPGSEAAGYADVAPSGATTVDTSNATPVDTSSSTTTSSGE